MIFFLVLFFIFENPVDNCIALLKAKEYKKAAAYFKTIKADKSDRYQFLAAYYKRDALQSIARYESLYAESKDTDIKYLSTQKLYEYYYSLGYYLKAKKLKGAEYVIPDNTKINKEEKYFILQCGVFDSKINAQKQKEKIAIRVKNKVYLKRVLIGNRKIYRVYIGNFLNLIDAEKMKLNLKYKLNIVTFIKQIRK